MLEYEISCADLDILINRFDKAPELVGRAVTTGMIIANNAMKSTARRLAPVGAYGNLHNNIESRLEGSAPILRGITYVRPSAGYGVFVEGGTNPHQLGREAIENLEAWVISKLHNKDLLWPIVRKIEKSGTKANKFFERSIDEEKEHIGRIFSTKLSEVASEIGL